MNPHCQQFFSSANFWAKQKVETVANEILTVGMKQQICLLLYWWAPRHSLLDCKTTFWLRWWQMFLRMSIISRELSLVFFALQWVLKAIKSSVSMLGGYHIVHYFYLIFVSLVFTMSALYYIVQENTPFSWSVFLKKVVFNNWIHMQLLCISCLLNVSIPVEWFQQYCYHLSSFLFIPSWELASCYSCLSLTWFNLKKFSLPPRLAFTFVNYLSVVQWCRV